MVRWIKRWQGNSLTHSAPKLPLNLKASATDFLAGWACKKLRIEDILKLIMLIVQKAGFSSLLLVSDIEHFNDLEQIAGIPCTPIVATEWGQFSGWWIRLGKRWTPNRFFLEKALSYVLLNSVLWKKGGKFECSNLTWAALCFNAILIEARSCESFQICFHKLHTSNGGIEKVFILRNCWSQKARALLLTFYWRWQELFQKIWLVNARWQDMAQLMKRHVLQEIGTSGSIDMHWGDMNMLLILLHTLEPRLLFWPQEKSWGTSFGQVQRKHLFPKLWRGTHYRQSNS